MPPGMEGERIQMSECREVLDSAREFLRTWILRRISSADALAVMADPFVLVDPSALLSVRVYLFPLEYTVVVFLDNCGFFLLAILFLLSNGVSRCMGASYVAFFSSSRIH
jgi:hypothetical protein